MSSFIWFENEKQLGFQVRLPDGRQISVDLKKIPGKELSTASDGTLLASGYLHIKS